MCELEVPLKMFSNRVLNPNTNLNKIEQIFDM